MCEKSSNESIFTDYDQEYKKTFMWREKKNPWFWVKKKTTFTVNRSQE